MQPKDLIPELTNHYDQESYCFSLIPTIIISEDKLHKQLILVWLNYSLRWFLKTKALTH